MIVLAAWLAPLFCVARARSRRTSGCSSRTQTVGRPLGLALDLLIAVAAAEEMPRNSRAYAVSVLAMASGLGAGVAVMALPLADLGDDGWRLVYVLSLIWLLVAVDLPRRLPETRRFEPRRHARHRRHALAPRAGSRSSRRSAFFANLFVAPASFFQNRYLDDVRGYTGGGIALFTLVHRDAGVARLRRRRQARRRRRPPRGARLVCLPLSTRAARRRRSSSAARPMWVGRVRSAACSAASPTRRSRCTAPSCSPPAAAAGQRVRSPRWRWSAAASACSLAGRPARPRLELRIGDGAAWRSASWSPR